MVTSVPTTRRLVRLVDAQQGHLPVVLVDLYRDWPPENLEIVEARWATARTGLAAVLSQSGVDLPEHSHWDWRNKSESVADGHHRLVAVIANEESQGLMAVQTSPRWARTDDGEVVYVDYLEAAPWNLRHAAAPPRFLGVGTALLAEAVRISLELGLDGRVGLHSLRQAEPFYNRIGMSAFGPDEAYFDLSYFEFTAAQASNWMSLIGETI